MKRQNIFQFKAVLEIWNFVSFYIKKGMPYLERLQKKYKIAVFKLKLGTKYYTVMNDFKATSASYDLTKVEKLAHLSSFSLNRTQNHGNKFSTFRCL